MKVITGSDDCGLNLKQEVMAYLKEKGVEFIDVTVPLRFNVKSL